MIIDTSALLAILFSEPSAERILTTIEVAADAAAGAPTLFEAEMVVSARRGERGVSALRDLLDRLEVEEIPFGSAHRHTATAAFLTFGRGRHPARLNLGDCLTYATAKVAQKPLLCVGGDFARTDLELVPLG